MRKLCSECRVQVEPGRAVKAEGERLKKLLDVDFTMEYIAGEGCPNCRGEGYKGRTAIHEVLVVNRRIRQMIVEKASESEIEQAALEEGMITMFEDGVLKVIQGITSLEEVRRVATVE